MSFEVKNLEATLADLRGRGVTFKRSEMSGFDVRGDNMNLQGDAHPRSEYRRRSAA
jgi:hypothetical protein